ncbi:hypothetical protein [Qipengyuania nanhaisediminis]|uniref:Uncharacterized protein n=1 Tax=Qipengyuania nanhaisediminis TaxID=604088 RepID=A0A1I5N4S8_9SPHN|nr:hypothetical protein [Qipengyuania nanhaisediminis]SFP16670.1 hypothetical protein SAMN04488060_1782 [Qipengyuania nanhaisediminis]
MTAKSRFLQADVTRALRAVKQAGCIPASCKIDEDGSITVELIGEAGVAPDDNPWDRELNNGPPSFPT